MLRHVEIGRGRLAVQPILADERCVVPIVDASGRGERGERLPASKLFEEEQIDLFNIDRESVA